MWRLAAAALLFEDGSGGGQDHGDLLLPPGKRASGEDGTGARPAAAVAASFDALALALKREAKNCALCTEEANVALDTRLAEVNLFFLSFDHTYDSILHIFNAIILRRCSILFFI